MIGAQAQLGRALQRVQQLAAESGASPELPAVSDADSQVGALPSRALPGPGSQGTQVLAGHSAHTSYL